MRELRCKSLDETRAKHRSGSCAAYVLGPSSIRSTVNTKSRDTEDLDIQEGLSQDP